MKNSVLAALALFLCSFVSIPPLYASEMMDRPVAKLRSLDKVTARTETFEAAVGSTVKFGALFIRVQACRKSPPVEKPEAAAFVQVWQNGTSEAPEWVFSGWMFASSPGLSSMDHPIYDVWVLDCLEKKAAPELPGETEAQAPGEGEIDEDAAP